MTDTGTAGNDVAVAIVARRCAYPDGAPVKIRSEKAILEVGSWVGRALLSLLLARDPPPCARCQPGAVKSVLVYLCARQFIQPTPTCTYGRPGIATIIRVVGRGGGVALRRGVFVLSVSSS